MIADIALPTMTVLVKKGIRGVLIALPKRHPRVYQKLGKQIALADYGHRRVDHEVDGRLDMEAKQKKLVEVVKDARTVRGSMVSSGPSSSRSCTTIGTCASVPSSGSYSIAQELPEKAIRKAETKSVLSIAMIPQPLLGPDRRSSCGAGSPRRHCSFGRSRRQPFR